MAKRQSLASFSPQPAKAPIAATGGKVVKTTEPEAAQGATKYPKVTVYLSAAEVRTLKLIGIEKDERVSDICAAAIREWLQRNGHARAKAHNA